MTAAIIDNTDTERDGNGETGLTTPTNLSYLLWPAELSLFAVSAAVVFGFSRVFVDWSFLFPLLAIAAATHVITTTTRRLGLGIGVSAISVTAGWIVLASQLWFAPTTKFFLPGPATTRAFRTEIETMVEAFQKLQAPVPAMAGFLIGISIALVLAVFLADWAAFRLWSPLEALVPSLALFSFATILASDQFRFSSAVAFTGSVCGFLLLHRVARTATATRPVTHTWRSKMALRPASSRAAILTNGGIICILALAIGAMGGTKLPGSASQPIYDWRSGGSSGDSSRVTVSPLVDIRSRLVDQSDHELFSVEANTRSYWRLTALDTFDGTIWRSGGRYARADGALDHPDELDNGEEPVGQRISITGLNALWLPAAFQPVTIDPGDAKVRYQAESSTLIVDSDTVDSNGINYYVESILPNFDAQALRQANSADVPKEIVDRYAQPPEGLSTTASRLAHEIVVGVADNPYESAIALQEYFQANFTYDIEVSSGHDGNAIDAFIESRRGYCEQFAGTFAAFARSLGIPARVAVGFTWGDEDPENPGRYIVRGRHAHAWPEVYLAGFGWVPFEPTPGRGMPGAESWTGITESQTTPVEIGAVTSTSAIAPSAPPTSTGVASDTPQDGPAQDDMALPDGESEPRVENPDANQDQLKPEEADPKHRSTFANPWMWVLFGILISLSVWIVVIQLISANKKRRHLNNALSDNAARVRLAWQQSTESLGMLGTTRLPNETHDEFAQRGAATVPEHAKALTQLAHDTDAATFAVATIDYETVERSEETASDIALTARRRSPWLQRMVRQLRLRLNL